MATWTPRTIKDQDVQHPYRYALKDIATGAIINTYDIVPTWQDNPSEITQLQTEINAGYLQPIEDFLKAVGDDLAALGLSITATNTALTNSETATNTKITTANARMDAINTNLASKAPLVSPVLSNATANTPAQTDNSTRLTTTAWTRTYFASLMAAYTG